MPEMIALIPAIIGAVGAGTSIYSLTQKPGAPKGPTPAETAAEATKTKQNQLAALSQQLPGLQERTGGSLSPEALARLAEVLSGQGGAPGIGSSVQDLITKLSGGEKNPFLVTAGNATGGTNTTGLTAGTSV